MPTQTAAARFGLQMAYCRTPAHGHLRRRNLEQHSYDLLIKFFNWIARMGGRDAV